MIPMIASTRSRLMSAPPTWIANPRSHNTKSTTTIVQIKLAMKTSHEFLHDSVAIMLPTRGGVVNLPVVARTRACGGLSTAGFARVAAAGCGREPKPVRHDPP